MENIRTRKHRAWHKTGQKMIYSSSANILKWLEEGQDIIIMDFSGLHDKNGKEIYEGDLLELANGEIISVSFNWGKFLGLRKNGTTSLTSFYWIYAKIIGNIYEPIELLNGNTSSQ